MNQLHQSRSRISPAPRDLTPKTTRSSRRTHPEPAHSAPISLPKTHIHRTPSELQFDDDNLKAEYSDVRMYFRLVYGMQSRRSTGSNCQLHMDTWCPGHYAPATQRMHPLTKKSLLGVVNTKRLDVELLERLRPCALASVQDLDDRCSLSSQPCANNSVHFSSHEELPEEEGWRISYTDQETHHARDSFLSDDDSDGSSSDFAVGNAAAASIAFNTKNDRLLEVVPQSPIIQRSLSLKENSRHSLTVTPTGSVSVGNTTRKKPVSFQPHYRDQDEDDCVFSLEL